MSNICCRPQYFWMYVETNVKGKTDRMIIKIKLSKNEVCFASQVKARIDHILMKVWTKEDRSSIPNVNIPY